jgi:hypothetical protein
MICNLNDKVTTRGLLTTKRTSLFQCEFFEISTLVLWLHASQKSIEAFWELKGVLGSLMAIVVGYRRGNASLQGSLEVAEVNR